MSSPLQWRSELASHGTTSLDLPKRCGGSGLGAEAVAKVTAACGYHDLDLRDVPGIGHARLLALAHTRRFDTLMTDVAAARAFVGIAVSETSGSSDLRGLATSARPAIGAYVLNGSKKYVGRAAECSHLIVFAQVPRDSARLTAFLVPREAEGVEYVPLLGMGLRGVSWSEVHFNDVSVPTSFRIGGEGEGASLFVRHFTYWRTLMAAAVLGCVRAALDQTAAALLERNAFGGPIGRFTHLQQRFAEHTARVHMLGLLLEHTAKRVDSNLPAVADAAMLKAEAVEIAIDALQFCMLAHGAAGYEVTTGLEKRLRDTLGLRVADGSLDVLRSQVAQAVLGNYLYNLSLGRPHKQDWSAIQTRKFW